MFLFHFKRQRKLSLRFLASYVLQEDIQQNTHDSIEDARTAVKLYQVKTGPTQISGFSQVMCREGQAPVSFKRSTLTCSMAMCTNSAYTLQFIVLHDGLSQQGLGIQVFFTCLVLALMNLRHIPFLAAIKMYM